MKVIHAQEQALVFEKFMNEDAYQIGTKIKQGVEKLDHDVVDSISLGDEQLFYYAMQSIRPHQPQLTWQKDPHSQHVPAEFVSGRPGDGSQRRYVCRFRSGTCKVRRCRRLLPD